MLGILLLATASFATFTAATSQLDCDAVHQSLVDVLVLLPFSDSDNSGLSVEEKLQDLQHSFRVSFDETRFTLVGHTPCPANATFSRSKTLSQSADCFSVYPFQDTFRHSIAAFVSDLRTDKVVPSRTKRSIGPSTLVRNFDLLLDGRASATNESTGTTYCKRVLIVLADVRPEGSYDEGGSATEDLDHDCPMPTEPSVQRMADRIRVEDITVFVFAPTQKSFHQWRAMQKNVKSPNVWVVRAAADDTETLGSTAVNAVRQQLCLTSSPAVYFPPNRYRVYDKVGSWSDYVDIAPYFTNAFDAGMESSRGVTVEELALTANFSQEKYGYNPSTDTYATDPTAEISRLCIQLDRKFVASNAAELKRKYKNWDRLSTYAKKRFGVSLEMGAPIWGVDGPQAFHFNQGGLGDCDFLARLGALVTHKEARLDIMDSIYPPLYSPAGVYSFLIYSDAYPIGRYHLIDDWIPDAKIGGTAAEWAQFQWYKLFEKMYLKRTNGDVVHSNRFVMRDFNHHFYYNVRLHKKDKYKTFWEDANTNRTSPITGIVAPNGNPSGPVRLPHGHVDTVIDLRVVGGHNFVVIHNPWNFNTPQTILKNVRPELYQEISTTKEYQEFSKRFSEKYVAWILLEDFIGAAGNVQIMDRLVTAVDHTGTFPSEAASYSTMQLLLIAFIALNLSMSSR